MPVFVAGGAIVITADEIRDKYTPEQIGAQLDYLDNEIAMWRGRKCYALAEDYTATRALWWEALPEFDDGQ